MSLVGQRSRDVIFRLSVSRDVNGYEESRVAANCRWMAHGEWKGKAFDMPNSAEFLFLLKARVTGEESLGTGQEKNFEIQLPSGPVHFSFQLPTLKYYLPNYLCFSLPS